MSTHTKKTKKKRKRGAAHVLTVGQAGIELHVGVGMAQQGKGLACHALVFGRQGRVAAQGRRRKRRAAGRAVHGAGSAYTVLFRRGRVVRTQNRRLVSVGWLFLFLMYFFCDRGHCLASPGANRLLLALTRRLHWPV